MSALYYSRMCAEPVQSSIRQTWLTPSVSVLPRSTATLCRRSSPPDSVNSIHHCTSITRPQHTQQASVWQTAYNVSHRQQLPINQTGRWPVVLLRPLNFHRHRGGWLPPNQHRRRSVIQCSRRSFWALFPENCPSLPQNSDSHLNAASFDPA